MGLLLTKIPPSTNDISIREERQCFLLRRKALVVRDWQVNMKRKSFPNQETNLQEKGKQLPGRTPLGVAINDDVRVTMKVQTARMIWRGRMTKKTKKKTKKTTMTMTRRTKMETQSVHRNGGKS